MVSPPEDKAVIAGIGFKSTAASCMQATPLCLQCQQHLLMPSFASYGFYAAMWALGARYRFMSADIPHSPPIAAFKKYYHNIKKYSFSGADSSSAKAIEFPVHTFTQTDDQLGTATSDLHIIYLCGGGYVAGIIYPQWVYIDYLLQRLGCTFHVPEYPLAPKYTYKDNFDILQQVYADIARQHSNVVLMGDSAGGGLALALAYHVMEHSLPLPTNIVMFSPWLDISLCNPDISKDVIRSDPFLNMPTLRQWALDYSGKDEAAYGDYHLSPIHPPSKAALSTLGQKVRVLIQIGSAEILRPDVVKFEKLASEAYIQHPENFKVTIGKGMIHGYATTVFIPEGRETAQEVLAWLRNV